MTHIEKLAKAINFINGNVRSIKDFVVVDGVPYKVTGYFHDYHKGTYDVTEKQLITDEQAAKYLEWPSIMDTINQILIDREARVAKQKRLDDFYASEKY